MTHHVQFQTANKTLSMMINKFYLNVGSVNMLCSSDGDDQLISFTYENLKSYFTAYILLLSTNFREFRDFCKTQ